MSFLKSKLFKWLLLAWFLILPLSEIIVNTGSTAMSLTMNGKYHDKYKNKSLGEIEERIQNLYISKYNSSGNLLYLNLEEYIEPLAFIFIKDFSDYSIKFRENRDKLREVLVRRDYGAISKNISGSRIVDMWGNSTRKKLDREGLKNDIYYENEELEQLISLYYYETNKFKMGYYHGFYLLTLFSLFSAISILFMKSLFYDGKLEEVNVNMNMPLKTFYLVLLTSAISVSAYMYKLNPYEMANIFPVYRVLPPVTYLGQFYVENIPLVRSFAFLLMPIALILYKLKLDQKYKELIGEN